MQALEFNWSHILRKTSWLVTEVVDYHEAVGIDEHLQAVRHQQDNLHHQLPEIMC
ncbi:hypothetical protein D3C72_2455120 [compost metagenome]